MRPRSASTLMAPSARTRDAANRRTASARPAALVPRLLIGAIIVGIAVRLILALFLGDHADPVSGAADQYSYDALAQRLAAGRGFTFPTAWYPFTQPDSPTAHWSFLYTAYLAGLYATCGHHPLVARILQVLLSAFGPWLTFVIGRRLFEPWAGVAAALLHVAYAYFVFFNAALMTQTFFILALLGVLALAFSMQDDCRLADWVLLGVLLGIGTLLRQTLLLFAPVLVGWLAWTQRGRTGWRGPLSTLAVVAALILPWTVRNYLVFGDFLLLNSNGGFWFYASNHPSQGVAFDPNYVAPIPAHLTGLTEPALDRALYREAAGFIWADPVRFLRLTLSRVPQYFWVLPSGRSTLISNLARVCSVALYLPFMAAGLCLSFRSWRLCLPLYLYVGFDTFLHLISWAAPRYRLPSDALMMIFAGLALERIAVRWGLVRDERGSAGR